MDAGFETTLSLKTKWRPDGSALAICREHGREIARQWALRPLTVSPVVAIDAAKTAETAETPAIMAAPSACACNSASTSQDNSRMQCSVCQWIYDPAIGEPMQEVTPGTPGLMCPTASCAQNVA